MSAPGTTRNSYSNSGGRRGIDITDVSVLVSTDDNLYVNFTKFAKQFARAVAKCGTIAIEATTGLPAKGTTTMLQKFKPTMPIPDGWDLALLSLADECPDLYANSKPTESEALLAYNKWLSYVKLQKRYEWYASDAWSKIWKSCDDDLRNIIDALNFDETDAPNLYNWLAEFCLGRGGSVRRRNRQRDFNDNHYTGGNVHKHVASMRKMQDEINAHGKPLAVTALTNDIKGAIAGVDTTINSPLAKQLIADPDFDISLDATIKQGLSADHTPARVTNRMLKALTQSHRERARPPSARRSLSMTDARMSVATPDNASADTSKPTHTHEGGGGDKDETSL